MVHDFFVFFLLRTLQSCNRIKHAACSGRVLASRPGLDMVCVPPYISTCTRNRRTHMRSQPASRKRTTTTTTTRKARKDGGHSAAYSHRHTHTHTMYAKYQVGHLDTIVVLVVVVAHCERFCVCACVPQRCHVRRSPFAVCRSPLVDNESVKNGSQCCARAQRTVAALVVWWWCPLQHSRRGRPTSMYVCAASICAVQ